MNKYILPLIGIVFFSGCATTNLQTQNPITHKSMKKALVKLIRENSELKQILQTHEQVIADNQNMILELKTDLETNEEKLDINSSSIEYLSEKIETNRLKPKDTYNIVTKKVIRENTPKKIIPLKTKKIANELMIEVTGNNLRLRVGPSLAYKMVAYTQKGDKFKVLDSTEGDVPWFKVNYQGIDLWLFSKFVRIVTPQNIELKAKNIDSKNNNRLQIKIDVEEANLRFKPDIDSKVVTVAKVNEVFNVLETYKNDYTWYKIIKNALPVWVYSGLVTKIKDMKNVK